jgi:hypothetical protein
MVKPLVYRGSREICSAVGINYKEITHYVRDYGLPAFKINGKTQWLATHDDLDKWIRSQRDTYLKK